ncbi:MAG: hypothetical protein P8Z73_10770, partial [Desulfobacteraceae bacterium]
QKLHAIALGYSLHAVDSYSGLWYGADKSAIANAYLPVITIVAIDYIYGGVQNQDWIWHTDIL